MSYRAKDPRPRIEAKFSRGDGCWLWHAALDRHGYGAVYFEGRVQRAHRAVYRMLVGPVPEGLVLDHLCRTPACVRPDHLEPVSLQVNFARGLDPTRAKKAQTHCVHGHPLSGANLIARPGGRRGCRECANVAQRKYYKKRLAS